jgi:uncharacterized membrane protein
MASPSVTSVPRSTDHFRFHRPHLHLSGSFGSEIRGPPRRFARFFGTPTFLIAQTAGVACWIAANVAGLAHFDAYPFILLNLAFSLQAAYAAPLILLAQTRQAARELAHAEADAQHREDLSQANLQRQEIAMREGEKLRVLLEANTRLTEQVQQMAGRIDALTREIHGRICVR